MQENADLIVDRRKLRRGLNKWRAIAIAALLAVLCSFIFMNDQFAAGLGVTDQIARVEVNGVITEDRARDLLLRKIAATPSVKAILVKFNSPGGTTTGGEALYKQLRELGAKRPLVAVFGTMATSAAYMSGVAADHIIARGNSITGSVGVIIQWAEVSQMMDKLGIQMNEMKSGNLKAVPTPFAPLDEEGRALTQEMIDESHKWFVDLIVERRKIKPDQIPGFNKGRIFSGRQALDYGLVDQIGGEQEALKFLATKHKISKDTPVIDWKVEEKVPSGVLGKASHYIAKFLGLEFGPLLHNVHQNGLMSVFSGKMISKWQN